MENNNSIIKAQNGESISVDTPLLDNSALENSFTGYTAPDLPDPQPTYRGKENVYNDPAIGSGRNEGSQLASLESFLLSKTQDKPGGSIMRTLDEVSSNRYSNFVPGDYNNEDAYGQNQSWGSKMLNGVGKGLLLTGTTFLQGTAGLVNGLIQWGNTGKFSSFYNNEFNKNLDELNKAAEDYMPNYYTDVEKNAKFYSPDYFMTGNFLWDGVVKNMGFAAGAYLTGGVYSAGLKGLAALPGASRLLSMGKAAEAVAKSEEMLLKLDKGTEAYGKIKQLSEGYLRTYNVLDKGHRAVVAGLSTSGEAGFEAYQNLNTFRNNKIQEYKDANGGVEPIGADLEKINRAADSVGNASFLGNVALLSATNYIQFPKILGSSYKAEKGIINNVTREIGDITTDAAGKYIAKVPKSKVLNTLNKIRPYTFSASEGFEEGAQFSIGVGVNDYYNKKYNNEATSWLDAVSTGITEGFLSDEGAKNVLIGGLSGAIMMGKSRFQEGREKTINTREAIKQFNEYQLSDFTKETKDSVNRGTVLQEEREQLLKEGNISESKDRETDYIINYLTPRIKFGRFDLVKAEIDDYRTLASTNDGFDQLVKEGKALPTDTREAFLARINNFEQTANNVKSLYQSLSLRYSGLVNEDKTPMYPPAVIDKMLYATTKISDYEQRIPSLTSKLIGSVKNLDDILQDATEGKLESFNVAVANLEASKLVNKEELIEALDDATFMTAKRDLLLRQYDELKKSPEKYTPIEAPVTDVEGNILDKKGNIIPKQTITIKTKNGDRDIETGVEYFLGKVVEYDKQGRPVFRAPIVKILGEEDGKIKIQDVKTGEVTLVDPSAIEDYKLGKVSEATKKDLWLINNANIIFQHRGLKNKKGQYLEGRIENHPTEGMMYFVYIDDKGVKQSIPVKNELFVAKKGYKRGLIAPKTKLIATEQQTLEQAFSAKEKKANTLREQAIKARNEVIIELYDESVKRLEQINKELDKTQNAIERVEKQLEEEIAKIPTTKSGTPSKKVAKVLRQSIDTLGKSLESLRNIENDLQSEKETVEGSLPYIQSFIDELSDSSEDNNDLITKLKGDVSILKDLAKITTESIDKIGELYKAAESLLNEALEELNDFIKDLKKNNPDTPIFIEDLQANVERFLGEKGAELYIQDRLGFTNQVMELEDQINDFERYIELPGLTKNAAKLKESLSELKEGLRAFRGEQAAKEAIIEKFEAYIEKEKQKLEEEEKVVKNKKIQAELLGTADANAIQNEEFESTYEANDKKPNNIIPEATITTGDKPHTVRSNAFGARLNSFENKDAVRGVHITAKNENDLIPGLTEHLTKNDDDVVDQSIDRDKIIALVMVDTDGDLLDVNGKKIESIKEGETKEQYNQRVLDSAIYQVMPLEKLQWGPKYNNNSMFREGTSEQYKSEVRKKYAEWRNETLEQTNIGFFHTVDASFGRGEMVQIADDKGNLKNDYTAKTSVQSAGLISENPTEDLATTPLIHIPKTNETAAKKTTSFKNALGQVFLELSNGYVKLRNRQHSDKEAKVIFDSLVKLSEYMMDKTKGLKSDEAVRLLTFLKSSVYWGIPETQQKVRKKKGYNSVFFERDANTGRMMLSISGKGMDFVFTPSGLLENEDTILGMLEGMYKNVNSYMAQNLNEPYEEITGVNTNGEVSSIMWPNYQSYLLSDKVPDANGNLTIKRNNNEIPVTTLLRPLEDENDVNRKNIYFFTTDNADKFATSVSPEKAPATVITPGMPKVKPKQTPTTVKPTIDTSREWKGDLESRPVYTTEGVNTMRSSATNAFENFGNPFSEAGYGGTIKVASIGEAVIAYKEWLLGTNHQDVKPQQREWILDQINQGKLDGATLLYAGKSEARGQGMHPTALAEVVEQLRTKQTVSAIDGTQVLIENIEAKRKEALASAKTKEDKEKVKDKYDELIEIVKNVDVAAPSQFVFDGKTLNIYIGETGNMIVFTAESGITAENYNDKIKIKPDLGDVLNIVKIVMQKTKLDQAGAVDNIKKSLANMLSQQESAPPAPSQEEFDEFEPYVEPIFEGGVKNAIEQVEQNTGKPVSNSVKSIINSKRNPSSKKARREIILQDLNKFKKEDWSKVEKWIKAVLPNIPVYRVKNVIQATNGKQAWGMFHNGAIYIYENAQVGTAYHEVFHAIWRMFTDTKEQEAIYNEFKNRNGKFFDRTSGKTINYSDATIDQMEEALAEEFRDYVHEGKKPGKPKDGRPFILKMFSDLVNFIKKLFLGKESASLVEQLFENINQGSYKASMPFSKELGYASKGIIDIDDISGDEESAFSLVEMGDIQRNEILQEMTYQTLLQLIDNDEDLFNIPNLKKSTIYKGLYEKIQNMIAEGIDIASELLNDPEYQTPEIQKQLQDEIANITQLMQQVENDWESIMDRHQEYLRGYSITFDENDEIALTDEEKSKEDPYGESTKIDHFKKANAAIKLLLSTVPVLDENGNMKISSVGGAILMPVSQTYISVMNNVHNSNNIEDMLEKLREMAVYDQTYAVLYDRITKSSYKLEGLDLSKVKTVHGVKLIDAFFNTFKKQNPDVKNVFILGNGEIIVGEANLSSAASQLRAEYLNQIITKAKDGKGFFKYNTTRQVYEVDSKKLRDYPANDVLQMLTFLGQLGVDFTGKQFSKLNDAQVSIFRDAVSGIRSSIANSKEIKSFSNKTLDMEKRLFQLGLLKASIDNPQFDSTFFNVSGERTQSFVGTNAASNLFTFLSNLTVFTKDALAGTNFSYLTTDSFVEGSSILKRKYADGKIISGSEDLLTVGYVGGIVNENTGKSKPSSKLDYRSRLIQELNLNLKGWYLNLIPGDASLEWMIKMGNPISSVSLTRGFGEVHKLFEGYFISELKLAREGRPIANVKGRSTNDMRFFKSILGDVLHAEIIGSTESEKDVYAQYEKKINSALDKFIETQKNTFVNTLVEYGVVKQEGYGYTVENVDLPRGMIEAEFNRHMNMLTVNYFIANIEMHKLLYSDPYQYTDELKRIKNFNSAGQPLMNSSPKMNKLYHNVWNKGYKKDDIGHTNFAQEYFRTAVHTDVNGIVDLPNYDNYKETDGAGMISFKAHRHFRIRSSNWNSNEEAQYKYDVVWEKVDKGIKLNPGEQEIYDEGNPGVKSAYTPSKPIARGNKANGNNYNDVVLDKFALYPVSYRIMKEINPTSNMVKLYNKMQKENIDYIVFESSRKVGVDKAHLTYNTEDSSFNETKYAKRTITNVPFSVLYVQAEVPSKDINLVTRGSQATKLMTMDFLEAGVPIDFEITKSNGEVDTNFNNRYQAWFKLSEEEKKQASELYTEIKNNEDLLVALIKNGYNNLLKTLGISNVNGEFKIVNFDKSATTLRNEILKREVNDNISAALKDFLAGKAILEATPAYQQVRNILYSIADREVVSSKMPGGMKVQIPSTLLESVRAKEVEVNGKKGLASDVLKFYEKDGKRVCEIMVGRWFKSDLSDDELLDLWYKKDKKGNRTDELTEEGEKVLSGIAFRIPSQKQNSIDSFVIKQFLPKEFGDSVVIPAALVAKAGSDFDIDKLSIYFKNVFVTSKGVIKLIELKGTKEETINFYSEEFDKLNQSEQDYIIRQLNKIDSEEEIDLDREEKFIEQQENLNLKKEDWLESMYRKALENAYTQSSQNLVSHPKNYDRLIQPNSAEQLKALGKFIAEKTTGQSFDYTDVGNMLDRTFMSKLRHAFVSGKYAIGIAAVNQTNHSLNQRQPIFIDVTKIKNLSVEDQFWIGNGRVTFEAFNKLAVGGYISPIFSMSKNAERSEEYPEGQDISDILAQFIDGYVDISKGPWIMELGATANVASTWMTLVKLGVPIDTVTYFMNQPIIRDYLKSVDTAGYSYLYIDTFVDEMMDKYAPKGQKLSKEEWKAARDRFQVPSKEVLKNSVGENISNMNKQQLETQQLMLWEFLKYSKMAEQMFQVTQGSNFDTASLNDPSLVFKKIKMLEKAQKTIISSVDEDGNTIAGVDALLKNSFLGEMGESIINMRDALAQILMSDRPAIRKVIEQVLTPYLETPDRDFVKIAQKTVNDLFDWAIFTNDGYADLIKSVLIKDGGTAKQIYEFAKAIKEDVNHPLHDNYVINVLEYKPSQRPGDSVNNLKIKGVDNKTFDQNNIIGAFRQIRTYIANEEALGNNKDSAIYKGLVNLAILQSGLSNSPISYTSLLPYEDFAEIYNPTLSKLEKFGNLDKFVSLGVFARNNWNSDTFVPSSAARWIKITDYMDNKIPVYNPSMYFLPDSVKDAVSNAEIPQIVTQSVRNSGSSSDYITFTWELQTEILTAEELKAAQNSKEGVMSAVFAKKNALRKAGDYSFMKRGLFQKVKDDFGTPLLHKDRKGSEYFVYKAINAWGDSFRANEFYDVDKQSVIENGMIKAIPTSNNLIIDIFRGTRPIIGAVTAKSEEKELPLQLKDGVAYEPEQINRTMLEAMGYTPKQIGKILKSIC